MAYHPKQQLYREAEELGLPTEVMGASLMEMTGDRQLLLHGKKGIRSYSDTQIIVELRECAVEISGRGLTIVMMTGQELLLRGTIDGVRFLR